MNTLSVKDLSLAAYLSVCADVQLVKTERNSTGSVFFHFSPLVRSQQLITDYWSDKAPAIQPRRLFSALRDLKELIFSGDNYASRS